MRAPEWGLLSCGLVLLPWYVAIAGAKILPEQKPQVNDSNGTLCTEYNCCPMQPHPHRLDCTYRNISQIREISVPTATISLSLQYNRIWQLERGTFIWAPTVLQLDLSNNNITSMSRGWWLPDREKRNITSELKSLSLANNLLKFVNYDSFDGLDTVIRLDLSYNRIWVLRENSFMGLWNLEELVLDYNPLHYVSSDCFAAVSLLRVLQMNRLGPVILPSNAFRFLPYLSTLGLAGNHLRHMPATILKPLVLLESLDLSENPFTKLSTSFLRGLPALKTLRLDSLGQLTRVEASAFADLPSLKQLHLSYSPKLTQVHPKAFNSDWRGHTVRLRELHLRQSGLRSLPPRLQDWKTMVTLDLSENAWNCDCRLRWMVEVATKLPTAFRPICAAPRSLQGRAISDLLPFEFSCEDSGTAELTSSIAMLCGIIASAAVVFVGVIVYNRCTPMPIPNYSGRQESSV